MMNRYQRLLTGPLSLAIILGPAWTPSARANLRAPVIIEQAPSSALYQGGGSLAVQREELRIDCETQRCKVMATYRVSARARMNSDFSFILPTAAPVHVSVNDRNAPARVSAFTPTDSREKELLRSRRASIQLYKATFQGALGEGGNVIRVTYSQPLAATERDYGYSRKGRFEHHFCYEIWPLKQWTLAKGFQLSVEVTMERPKPTWWQRTFKTPRSLSCSLFNQQGGGSRRLSKEEPAQEGDRLVLRATLGASLPDRLQCSLGDRDLLPR